MSGHSKWANIQHRKGRQDAKRSNLWTKLVREIIVAARVGGGGDPDMNSRLRLAVLKAREGNVPKDTINNAILKGTGQLEGVSYEEVRYEGYGIGGASLIIDCTTDNRTRTVADVRRRKPRHRRLRFLPVQALRRIPLCPGHGRRQGYGNGSGSRCRRRNDRRRRLD